MGKRPGPGTAPGAARNGVDQQAVAHLREKRAEVVLAGVQHEVGEGRLRLAERGTPAMAGGGTPRERTRFEVVDAAANHAALDERRPEAGDALVIHRSRARLAVAQRIVGQEEAGMEHPLAETVRERRRPEQEGLPHQRLLHRAQQRATASGRSSTGAVVAGAGADAEAQASRCSKSATRASIAASSGRSARSQVRDDMHAVVLRRTDHIDVERHEGHLVLGVHATGVAHLDRSHRPLHVHRDAPAGLTQSIGEKAAQLSQLGRVGGGSPRNVGMHTSEGATDSGGAMARHLPPRPTPWRPRAAHPARVRWCPPLQSAHPPRLAGCDRPAPRCARQ